MDNLYSFFQELKATPAEFEQIKAGTKTKFLLPPQGELGRVYKEQLQEHPELYSGYGAASFRSEVTAQMARIGVMPYSKGQVMHVSSGGENLLIVITGYRILFLFAFKFKQEIIKGHGCKNWRELKDAWDTEYGGGWFGFVQNPPVYEFEFRVLSEEDMVRLALYGEKIFHIEEEDHET